MQEAGYEMGGALTCPHFSRRWREGSAVHPLARCAQSSPFVPLCQPQTPSNSEYRQERLRGAPAGVMRCKIIVAEQNICRKWRSALDFQCIFCEFVDSFWQGGIMKHYSMKCVLTDRCVWDQFYSSKVAPISNSFGEDYAKSVHLGIPD